MKSLLHSKALMTSLCVLLAGFVMCRTTEPAVDSSVKKATLEELSKIAANDFTKIIDGTISPNKRLAVVVGSLDGLATDWEKLSRDDIPGYFIKGYKPCRNYLLDIKADRVIGILESKHFGTHRDYNHTSLRIAWSPDSRWLFEVENGRFDTWVCTVHRLSAVGQLMTRLDFLPTAKRIVDGHLRERFPKLTPEERAYHVVTVSDLRISNDGSLTARVSAEIPKDMDHVGVSLSVSAKVEVTKNGELSIRVTKIEPPKE